MYTLPTALYTTAQIRHIEQLAIHEMGIPSFELMVRAGQAVFAHLQQQWPKAKNLAILCGAGNNAGDGYVVAKRALETGLVVTVYSVVPPTNLTGDALTAYQHYIGAGGEILPYTPSQSLKADVLVDALLGTGLNKPTTGIMADAITTLNNSGIPIMAVDIPSGIHADTGAFMGNAVMADCTVTFIGLKQGLLTGQAVDYTGSISLNDLALPTALYAAIPSSTYRITYTPLPPRPRYCHKGRYGHVLVIGGDLGYSGAARLAGEAALRTGAGLVSIATRKEHAGLLNIGRPELMCHGIEDALQLKPLFEKASTIVIGPGLGSSDWARSLFIATVNTGKSLVIDADGLTFLANARIKNPDWILTPHPGEAARLLHKPSADIEANRFVAATAIQARYDGHVVLKGAGTLVVSNHDIAISSTGNAGMASGGMGDVLAGVIAGLVAQGMAPKQAAQQGAYLHGLAGDRAVQHQGERGLLASDLLPYLGQPGL
jgi:ADP-dependent NAD(P)H-hydrate dehydratase / NAD(P)H-hydrate epimerase